MRRPPSLSDERLGKLYVLVVAAGVVVPLTISSFASAPKSLELLGQVTSVPPVARWATFVGNAVILATSAWIAALMRRRWRLLLGPALLLLAAWAASLTQLVAAGARPTSEALILPAVVVAVALLRPAEPAVRAVGAAVTATALLSLAMAALSPGAGRYLRPETLAAEKYVLPWGIVAGPYPSGNNLGVALAVGLPTVLAFRNRWTRLAAATLVGAALVASASRTSVVAAALAVLVWGAVHLARSAATSRRLATASLVAAAATWVVLPLLTRESSAFTNRGGYWIASLQAWLHRPWFGWGPGYFRWLHEHGAPLGNFAYHAHNQLVQLLVTGGLLLTGCTVAALVWGAVRLLRATRPPAWGVAVLIGFLAASAFEVPLGFVDRSMYVPFVAVPLLLVMTGRLEPDRR